MEEYVECRICGFNIIRDLFKNHLIQKRED
jgi:hypothetical protein